MSAVYDSAAKARSRAPFLRDLLDSLRKPEFWAFSSWLDIVSRYRRTRLGLAWMFLPMAIWIGILGNFYAQVMGHPPAEYLPYLGVGYLLWRFIVMATNDATSAFRSHKSFILDGRIRLTDYVLRTLAKATLYIIMGSLVVLVVLIWSPSIRWQNILTVFLTFPVFLANMIWWVFVMSLFGARFPDTSEAIHTALMLGFLLTPILWVGDRFTFGGIAWFLALLNPAYHLISLVRNPVLGQPIPHSTLLYVAVLTLGGWLLAMVLYRRYARYAPLWI
jgi:ABC-type polysaccharide/polyol phosphate export permease